MPRSELLPFERQRVDLLRASVLKQDRSILRIKVEPGGAKPARVLKFSQTDGFLGLPPLTGMRMSASTVSK